ncbi:hypothetical protein [Luteibacter sp. UNCMF366Tsu5.1]|uniref:hypothetical protein n=1 Tax=Luteibacter sp. UNCMF366Tsu5.1 TaxID=1502758 RepID=UPI000908F6F0|nr:hypothetical protein [Luteibacter sp. UNCMF366Tsu5.1]SFW75417.1 hypothetical protein SAMN02800691_3548 [Luteibacter sp. UNCMF366Tsu5.1]
MASIFTGLAFMHGHIADRELVLRLGSAENPAQGAGGPATIIRQEDRQRALPPIAQPACAAC